MKEKDLYDIIREDLKVCPIVTKCVIPIFGINSDKTDFIAGGLVDGGISSTNNTESDKCIIQHSFYANEFRTTLKLRRKLNNPIRMSDFRREGMILKIIGGYNEIEGYEHKMGL